MAQAHKVLIFGAAGRVGLGLTAELIRHKIDVVGVDCVSQELLNQKLARIIVDNRISKDPDSAKVTPYGDVDVLNEASIVDILTKEQPDVVVNYAIPFTWDAAKQLNNYPKISRAGLGAFSAIQVLAPKVIARAIAIADISPFYLVGNLPDITVPIIYGLGSNIAMAKPICGAGNVGLIEAAVRQQLATERNVATRDFTISLCAHHIHWVAPREPGYRNDAPFLMNVIQNEQDITSELGDLRALMNRAIVNCYEPGAGFSSTTSRLAAENILALLGEQPCRLHTPAPNGMPGGHPVIIDKGVVTLDLPDIWSEQQATETMLEAHTRDGIDKIAEDGTIYFDAESVEILQNEMGFALPLIVAPHDLDTVAKAQIAAAQQLINKL